MTNSRLDTSHNDRPTLRVHGPADLLQAVPYLLGFHPHASLVLVGLHDAMLVVTVRIDLADAAVSEVLADALAAMNRGGATGLVAAVYDDGHPDGTTAELPWGTLIDALAEQTDDRCLVLLDALLVADGRWWSYRCHEPGCCPEEGRALPAGTSEFSAAATYAGMVALPDRAALRAVLDPRPQAERDVLHDALAEHENDAVRAVLAGDGARHERSLKRALFAAARSSDDPSWSGSVELDETTVARFGAGLAEYALRDSVWMAIDDGRLDGRALWRHLAARLPSPYDAAPLFLFAWCSWRAGNGALAGIAAERAITADPGYSAADLLLAALQRGVDPRRLPRLRLPRSA